ncbi:hypothetical protein PV328_002917 [Microctonus aethiopoides]|uniref:Uncharacterized protein n=1 Tax=Microctonus aethiopoides TaxID=144406 RepID=A0AA39F7A6_9HYME|nr:hypothetical protein PV328_002917 [Microctonus aethiopoides]
MTMYWRNISTDGILRQEYAREIQWGNTPPALFNRSYYPNSVHSNSSSGSISSSSSWTSSQESLNLYGSSPESPRMIALKPEDRLRRIREDFIYKHLNKMEIDEEEEFKSKIFTTKQSTTERPPSITAPIDDNLKNPDAMESIRSVSLRFKRFREAHMKQNKTVQNKIDIYKLLPLRPWERETPSTNKLRRPHSYKPRENNIQPSYNRENIPRWMRQMMPIIAMKPLRRPKIISHEDAKCDPECRDDLRCFTINHKDVCRCQAGYKLQKNSTTKCERDPQCNGFRRMFFCSYNATTWNYTVEIGR